MILLGVDPGTASTGYGFVDVSNHKSLVSIDYGLIKTSKDHLMSKRLVKIFSSAKYLMTKYSPDAVIIERIFFNTNVKTALSVGQARGVFMLAAGEMDIPVFEYTALEAKMVLTGYGRSDKDQVRKEVEQILNIKTHVKPIDASDALAMALCHFKKAISA